MKRLLVAVVLLTTGCSSSLACSLVGCASVAQLRLHDLSPSLNYPLTAHACLDARCADMTIEQQPPAAGAPMSLSCQGQGRHACVDLRATQGYVGIAFQDPPAGTRAHAARLLVRDAGGAVVVDASQPLTLVRSAPNGERCGPVCWSGTADFRGSG